MTNPNGEMITGQTPLTAVLLQSLIEEAGALASQAHALLAPAAGARDELRDRLGDTDDIMHIGPPVTGERTIVAVDGGSVREHLYAADLMVAVAVAAEGMTSTQALPLSQAHWTRIIAHESENDRLLSCAMASLEVRLLADLTHDLRILDGSHGTPVIALSTALTARSRDVRLAALAIVNDSIVEAIRVLANPHPGNGVVIALPKADSSRYYSDDFKHKFGLDLPGGDRFLAAQLLQPGEMLRPREANEISTLHFPVPENAEPQVQELCRTLDDAIKPMRDAAQARNLRVTYLKPFSADVVIKMEFRGDDAEAARLARLVSDETPGPYLQEPFAQYAVDLAAKSVSVGAEALNQAMLAQLPAEGSEGYIMWLARSYRTNSGGGGSSKPGGATPKVGGPNR